MSFTATIMNIHNKYLWASLCRYLKDKFNIQFEILSLNPVTKTYTFKFVGYYENATPFYYANGARVMYDEVINSSTKIYLRKEDVPPDQQIPMPEFRVLPEAGESIKTSFGWGMLEGFWYDIVDSALQAEFGHGLATKSKTDDIQSDLVDDGKTEDREYDLEVEAPAISRTENVTVIPAWRRPFVHSPIAATLPSLEGGGGGGGSGLAFLSETYDGLTQYMYKLVYTGSAATSGLFAELNSAPASNGSLTVTEADGETPAYTVDTTSGETAVQLVPYGNSYNLLTKSAFSDIGASVTVDGMLYTFLPMDILQYGLFGVGADSLIQVSGAGVSGVPNTGDVTIEAKDPNCLTIGRALFPIYVDSVNSPISVTFSLVGLHDNGMDPATWNVIDSITYNYTSNSSPILPNNGGTYTFSTYNSSSYFQVDLLYKVSIPDIGVEHTGSLNFLTEVAGQGIAVLVEDSAT